MVAAQTVHNAPMQSRPLFLLLTIANSMIYDEKLHIRLVHLEQYGNWPKKDDPASRKNKLKKKKKNPTTVGGGVGSDCNFRSFAHRIRTIPDANWGCNVEYSIDFDNVFHLYAKSSSSSSSKCFFAIHICNRYGQVCRKVVILITVGTRRAPLLAYCRLWSRNGGFLRKLLPFDNGDF